MKLASFTGNAVYFPRNIYETIRFFRGFDRCLVLLTWESMNFRDFVAGERIAVWTFRFFRCLIHLKSKLLMQLFFFVLFVNLHSNLSCGCKRVLRICSYFFFCYSPSIKVSQFYEISWNFVFHLQEIISHFTADELFHSNHGEIPFACVRRV